MLRIHLEQPLVEGQTATFAWRTEPATPLYRRSNFTLTFPPTVDLSRVPDRLWWDVFLICLHAHWPLLSPCEIHLPLRLGAAERSFWLRLVENGANTLDSIRRPGTRRRPFDVRIVDGEIDIPRRKIEGDGLGTSFSGGKDSLLQTGLLTELADNPLAVATTSPMAPLHDHETARRRQVFDAIQSRRRLRFVEVKSDYRSAWYNFFPGDLGYPVAVSELTDSFLYTSNLVLVGAATGTTHLFVASEVEVQENIERDGRIVQHPHFMYSAATQRSLAALLAPYGLRYGSLTWPLYSRQVQRLLWDRYPDISDLQYSCWKVQPDEAACSQCSQCLRIAMAALADGHDPRRMGMNLHKLMAYSGKWRPGKDVRLSERPLPGQLVAHRFVGLVAGSIVQTSRTRLAWLLADRDVRRLFAGSTRRGLRRFDRLRERARPLASDQILGFREAFCEWIDPVICDRLKAIYAKHFPIEPRAAHEAVFERSEALMAYATAPLS